MKKRGSRKGARVRATPFMLSSILVLFSVGTAHALPIVIQVDYGPRTLGDVTCSGILSPELCSSDLFASPGSEILSLTFGVDDSLRAIDGSYDVSSSLQGSFWDAHTNAFILFGGTLSFTASAIAQGGLFTDLLLNIQQTYVLDGGVATNLAVTGSSGAYATLVTFDYSGVGLAGSVQGAYTGTYAITQPPALPVTPGPGPVIVVPEPGTLALFGLGFAGLGLFGRARRRH